MPETMTTYEHVQLNDEGVPIIVGSTMKVVELVMAQSAHGWSPEELLFQHPYLTLGQIHSALAYYISYSFLSLRSRLDSSLINRQ